MIPIEKYHYTGHNNTTTAFENLDERNQQQPKHNPRTTLRKKSLLFKLNKVAKSLK